MEKWESRMEAKKKCDHFASMGYSASMWEL